MPIMIDILDLPLAFSSVLAGSPSFGAVKAPVRRNREDAVRRQCRWVVDAVLRH